MIDNILSPSEDEFNPDILVSLDVFINTVFTNKQEGKAFKKYVFNAQKNNGLISSPIFFEQIVNFYMQFQTAQLFAKNGGYYQG